MMNKLISGPISVVLASLLLSACEPEFANVNGNISSGDADFSTFVALGDSLTAGYADSALYRHGQVNSYPAILAQQFALAGGGAFTQPLMPVEATGSLLAGGINLMVSDRLVLVPTGNPASPLGPSPITPPVLTQVVDTPFSPLVGPFNNLGVPGAKSFHLGLTTYGDPLQIGASANPYFVRFASATNATMIGDATDQMPSFFVLWVGNNDILSYATSGGVGVDQNAADNLNPASYGPNDITDDTVFAGVYGAPTTGLVDLLTSGTNRGVLVNIPDVTTIPYFTTVPYNAIPMSASFAAFANSQMHIINHNAAVAGSALSPAEMAQRTITYVAGQNAMLIDDDELPTVAGIPNKWRQATAADYITLPTSPKIGTEQSTGNPTTVWGVGTPLTDADVLTEAEVARVENARAAFNATIAGVAAGNARLLLFDASAKLTELRDSGIFYGTGGITSTFATGGGFSLDGVHPTARGYAVVANAIIDVINAGFGASIPKVDPGQYSTVFYQ